MCKRLAIFNDITEMISGTKYPTANIYFPQICEIKMALSEWVNSPNEVIQNMAEKMLQKFDSYWSVIHVIMGVATVLDPRYKMELLEFYFESIYPMDFFSQVNRIRNLCYDLVSEYQAKSIKILLVLLNCQMWLVMERVNCVIMIDTLKERKGQEPQL